MILISYAAGSNSRYELTEPLLSLQASAAALLQRPKLQADALLQLVRQARKSGRVTQGLMAVRSVQALAQGSSADSG